MRRPLLFVPTALLLLLAASCGGGSSGSGQSAATPEPSQVVKTVDLTATEFTFSTGSTITLDKAGIYEFDLTNGGKFPHALEIQGNGLDQKTATLQPNGNATLKVSLKAGTYDFYCPVGDHKQRGMEGQIVVK
jgi:plastocyanin